MARTTTTTARAAWQEDLGSLPLPEAEAELAVAGDGLSAAEATRRLQQYGPNALPEQTVNPVLKFLSSFIACTRGPFWSRRPVPISLGAVLGRQAIATLIAVRGFLMAPIGLGRALAVWLYALAWLLVNARVKLLMYWVLDRRSRRAATPAKAIAAAAATGPHSPALRHDRFKSEETRIGGTGLDDDRGPD